MNDIGDTLTLLIFYYHRSEDMNKMTNPTLEFKIRVQRETSMYGLGAQNISSVAGFGNCDSIIF